MGRGSSWALDDITVVADALASGESVYQVTKEHGWAYSSVKKLCRRLHAGTTGRVYRGPNGRGSDSPQKEKVQHGLGKQCGRTFMVDRAEKAMAAGFTDV